MKTRPWLVVLNWHGRDDTLELLSTLAREPVEIVVVDNGSYDGTLEAIAASHPGVHRVQSGANLGYAGGNNVGIAYALDHGADVVGVLNNDTLVEPGFCGPLMEALAAHPRSAVSPDIRYADRPAVSWWRGSRWDDRGAWMTHVPPADQSTEPGSFRTPALTGCCILTTAEVWRSVGTFDEGLFLIFEDADWSARARAVDVDLWVVPQSRISHKVSRSFSGTSTLVGAYFFTRNGLLVTRRHYGVRAMVRFLVRTVAPHHYRSLRSRQGRAAAHLAWQGVLDAVRGRLGPASPKVRRTAERSR